MGVPVLTPPLVHDTDALAEDVMALLQKIVDELDSNIDRDNLKNLEVITNKLATGAVTTPKIADKAVTPPKIGLKGASVFNTTDQAFGGANTVVFNSEYFDTDGVHSTGGSNNLLTCKTAGLYYIWGKVRINDTGAGAAAASLALRFDPGGAGEAKLDLDFVPQIVPPELTVQPTLAVSAVFPLAVNQTVDLLLDTGGTTLNVPGQDGSVPYYNNFGMVALGVVA